MDVPAAVRAPRQPGIMSTNDPDPHGPSWITANIRSYGMVIIAVGSGRCSEPGCDGEHPVTQPWSYTIGRVESGRARAGHLRTLRGDGSQPADIVDDHGRHCDPTTLGVPICLGPIHVRLDRVPATWVTSDDNPMGRWFAYYHGTGRLTTSPRPSRWCGPTKTDGSPTTRDAIRSCALPSPSCANRLARSQTTVTTACPEPPVTPPDAAAAVVPPDRRVTHRPKPASPISRRHTRVRGAGGYRTHDPGIMSPLL